MCLSTVLECTVCHPTSRNLSNIVTTECVDNAHFSPDNWVDVWCNSTGNWLSYYGALPNCECDNGYREKTIDFDDGGTLTTCEGLLIEYETLSLLYRTASIFVAIPSCPARDVGLVRYPTSLALDLGSKHVVTRCADNAGLAPGSSLSVSCTASGDWLGPTPQCHCNEGYQTRTVGGRELCIGMLTFYSISPNPSCGLSFAAAVPTCQAKREGLVHYPTTLAPRGSVNVNAQCADNAHIRSSSSLRVRCTSSGWIGNIPDCECDNGYRLKSFNWRQFCEGK